MKKSVAILLAMSLSLPAVPVLAQDMSGYLQTQQDNNIRMAQQRALQKRQAERRQGNRKLSARQQACAKKYRTYNPATDRYVVRKGQTRRCPL